MLCKNKMKLLSALRKNKNQMLLNKTRRKRVKMRHLMVSWVMQIRLTKWININQSMKDSFKKINLGYKGVHKEQILGWSSMIWKMTNKFLTNLRIGRVPIQKACIIPRMILISFQNSKSILRIKLTKKYLKKMQEEIFISPKKEDKLSWEITKMKKFSIQE
jgi:hypothetical protein